MLKKTCGDLHFGFCSCTTPHQFFYVTGVVFFDFETSGSCGFGLLQVFNSSGRLQRVPTQTTRTPSAALLSDEEMLSTDPAFFRQEVQ